MKNLLFVLSSLFLSFSAVADEISFQDFPNHYLKCTHKMKDESGKILQFIEYSEFEYGADSYFAYSNADHILSTSRMNAHLAFRFDANSKTYHFYYATRTYLNRNLFEVIEERVGFSKNQQFEFTHEAKKSNRAFTVSCLIKKK